MRICLIAEGSYPYVAGGVSSWIHSLMTTMKEHEFIIYAIGAETKQKGQYKYQLPPNVVELKEIFLDEYLYEKKKWGKRYNLSTVQKESLISLINNDVNVPWNELFDLIRSKKFSNVGEFLSSKDYYDLVEFMGKNEYTQAPFTELYWTISSMLLPLISIIQHEVPKADIYHAVSTGYAGVIGTLAKHLYQKPLVLTEHGIYSREREEEIIKADWVKGYFKDIWINYFYTLSSSIYHAADQVVTLFNRNREIEIELGCPDEKIQLIPNGVEWKDYQQLEVKSDTQHIRIGAIVRVVPIKDIKTMIQSFALVEKKIPNVELYIMGPTDEDSEYYEECLQLVEALEIKNIVFTGLVNIKDFLGQIDFFLLTSISEGQPLAILEGLACGKPFVCTNVGGCQEMLFGGLDDDCGQAGFIAPVMHYEEIAHYMIELCNKPELRREFGKNGLERVKHFYTRSALISNYRQLYQSIGEE